MYHFRYSVQFRPDRVKLGQPVHHSRGDRAQCSDEGAAAGDSAPKRGMLPSVLCLGRIEPVTIAADLHWNEPARIQAVKLRLVIRGIHAVMSFPSWTRVLTPDGGVACDAAIGIAADAYGAHLGSKEVVKSLLVLRRGEAEQGLPYDAGLLLPNSRELDANADAVSRYVDENITLRRQTCQ